jgi:hypothetical protein
LYFRELQVEGVKLLAFMVGFFGDVKFKEFSLDRFFLVDGIDVLIEVF